MTHGADTAAILVCAGNATRMGGIHKILHPLGNTTVLHQVLRSFCQCESIAELLVICRQQDTDEFLHSISEIEAQFTPRDRLWLTQTPQVFARQLYADALNQADAEGKDYTDGCQLVEALGAKVTMTRGDYSNIKLTTPEDFAVAEALLRELQGGD